MTIEEIKSYEAMAKLDLPDDEREAIMKKTVMLEKSFSELETVNTEGVQPLITVLDMMNVFREDVAVKMMPREKLLESVIASVDGYIQVPKTLE